MLYLCQDKEVVKGTKHKSSENDSYIEEKQVCKCIFARLCLSVDYLSFCNGDSLLQTCLVPLVWKDTNFNCFLSENFQNYHMNLKGKMEINEIHIWNNPLSEVILIVSDDSVCFFLTCNATFWHNEFEHL